MLQIDMIRNGLFGQDYGMKLVLALVGITLCFLFWHYTKKRDYLVVFLTGTIIWSFYEVLITVLSIRSIQNAVLFGSNLPWIGASILRGASEGSVVALVGITAGDYIPDKRMRKYAIPAAVLLLSFFVIRTLLNGMPYKDYGGLVLSRRNVFALPSVMFFILLFVFNMYWYLRMSNPSSKNRAFLMFIATLVFSTIWSLAQFIANVRWIEVDMVEPSILVTILVFAWDIIFEVAMCYVSFYTLPNFLGFIENPITNQ